jgi:(2Fe-2S) ferredoxin
MVRDIFGRPARERRLVVCKGPCCDRLGEAKAILAELRSRLAAAEAQDGRLAEVSCIERACLGKCTGDPVACVLPDEVFYSGLSPDNLLHILREHVIGHRPVEELLLIE